LVEGNAEQRLLDLLLERCHEGGWLEDTDAFKDTYRHRAGIVRNAFSGNTHDGMTPLALPGLAQDASGSYGW
jgi:hypothetical protein